MYLKTSDIRCAPMYRLARIILLITVCTASVNVVHAQFADSGPGRFDEGSRDRFQVFSVALFAQRFQTTAPFGSLDLSGVRTFRDLTSGIAGTLGWSRRTATVNTSFIYSGSFGARPNNLDLSSNSHSLSVQQTRKSSERTSWDFSLGTTILQSQDLLFTPSALSSAVQSDATLDDLAGAGRGGNNAAALLTRSPAIGAPARLLALGNHILTSSVQSGWSFSSSPLTSYTVRTGYSRFDRLSGATQFSSAGAISPGALAGSVGLINSYGAINVQSAISHSLSPQSSVGVDISVNRTFSRNESAYIYSTSTYIDRRLSRNLIGHASLGVGVVKPIGRTSALIDRPEIIADGSLTWKVYEQTLTASVTRSLADTIGLGAAVFTSYSGAWSWSRPASAWLLVVDASLDHFQDARFEFLKTWRASGGVRRKITPQLAFSVQYARMAFTNKSSSRAAIRDYDTLLDGASVSLIYVPRRGPAW